MKRSVITLNIAILPDTQTRDEVIGLSKRLSESIPTHFTLNVNDLLPHITVYQAAYPIKSVEKVKRTVSGIAKNTAPFKVIMDGVSISHHTFLFFNCIKSDKIMMLHNKIVGKANALREGQIIENLPIETEEDRFDATNYGALLIGQRYSPHITLTRIKNPEDKDMALQLANRIKRVEFEVKNLIIGELGKHGTVRNIISTYSLLP